jgi:deoxyribose-phosphate aldolase
MKINKFIEHTLVRPNAKEKEIMKLCQEAKKYDFYSVCVPPIYVKLAKRLLKGSGIKVITVIGFPHGTETTLTKVLATKEAIKNGADEIDMVLNISWLKSKKYHLIKEEFKKIRKVTKNRVVKVILETGYLTKKEIKKACQLAKQTKLDFVKTCTGFGPGKAKIEDIKFMKKIVGKKMGVKASGGIRDYQTALEMLKAGATRIGTSAGVEIMKGEKSRANY